MRVGPREKPRRGRPSRERRRHGGVRETLKCRFERDPRGSFSTRSTGADSKGDGSSADHERENLREGENQEGSGPGLDLTVGCGVRIPREGKALEAACPFARAAS
jgi:hypothetical protein